MSGSRTPVGGGGIIPGAVYVAADLMRVAGLGRHGIAELRRQGVLKPVTLNNRVVYFADDLLAHLKDLQRRQYG